MRISHKYKFVFIAIPRTGSTALRTTLDDISDIKSTYKHARNDENPFYHHISAKEIRDIFIQKSWNWDSYTKFCVIRNPYDRAVSLYHHRLETASRVAPNKHIFFNIARKIKYKYLFNKNFSQWLSQESSFQGLSRSQADFVTDENQGNLVDHYIRFENLQADFTVVAEKLGIGEHVPVIEKTNDSKNRKVYRDYYTDSLKEIIKKRYAYELNQFNYEY